MTTGICPHGESPEEPVIISRALPVGVAMIQVEPSKDPALFPLMEEVSKLRAYADALVIRGVEDIKTATNDLSIISRLKKLFEEKRKSYTVPLNDYLKDINEAFKVFTDPLNGAEKTTKDKMLAYGAEQRRIQAEQEGINALRIEAAQKEMELKGEISEPVNLVEVAPEAPKHVYTDMGTTGVRENWKYEVVDILAVPREYLVIDSAMLNSIAKKHHDTKKIDGIRFFNEPIIAVRAK